jgi:hypothetical protein
MELAGGSVSEPYAGEERAKTEDLLNAEDDDKLPN